jgi:hypothetical protein
MRLEKGALCATTCIINGGVQRKFVVLVFKLRLVSWDSDALRIPATAYAQTLWAMALGSGYAGKGIMD